MTLEEIKAAIVERIDSAWNEVKDKVDADQVRTYVQGLTAELTSHVYAVEAALVNHVLGKQDPTPAEPSPAPATGDQPAVDTPASVPAAAEQTPAQASTDPAPADSAPANPTGMASNAPAADEAPAPVEPGPAQ